MPVKAALTAGKDGAIVGCWELAIMAENSRAISIPNLEEVWGFFIPFLPAAIVS